MAGVGPATSRLTAGRICQLSYTPKRKHRLNPGADTYTPESAKPVFRGLGTWSGKGARQEEGEGVEPPRLIARRFSGPLPSPVGWTLRD